MKCRVNLKPRSVDIDNRNTVNFYFIFNQDIVKGDGFTVPELDESPEMLDHTRKTYLLSLNILIKNEIKN